MGNLHILKIGGGAGIDPAQTLANCCRAGAAG
ncbi:MAG: hypothetical protein UZ15_CFX003000334, partial [Chloroflexi bacterium OLB15]